MKKINWKNTGRTFTWIFLGSYMIVLLSFTAKKSEEVLCHTVKVVVTDSTLNRFVQAEQIKKMLLAKNDKIHGYPLKDINTKETEEMLARLPFTREVDVFKTMDGTLHVEIKQRRPIVKIFNMLGESYYIDEEGFIVPSSGRYSAHVLVANGYIRDTFKPDHSVNLLKTSLEKKSPLYDIYTLAKFIDSKPFWKSQFEQLYVNGKKQYELIPRVGAHVILLGTAEDYEYKFRKLKSLYRSAFNKLGWNDYEYINLKYKNQVICTKR